MRYLVHNYILPNKFASPIPSGFLSIKNINIDVANGVISSLVGFHLNFDDATNGKEPIEQMRWTIPLSGVIPDPIFNQISLAFKPQQSIII